MKKKAKKFWAACQDCGVAVKVADLKNQWPNIPNLSERVAPGEPAPAGECPYCGALCQLVDVAITEDDFPIAPSLLMVLRDLLDDIDNARGTVDIDSEAKSPFASYAKAKELAVAILAGDFDTWNRVSLWASLAASIGVSGDDLTNQKVETLVTIGQGMFWSEEFDKMIGKIADSIKEEMELAAGASE